MNNLKLKWLIVVFILISLVFGKNVQAQGESNVHFESSWDYTTGGSCAAVTDNGAWTSTSTSISGTMTGPQSTDCESGGTCCCNELAWNCGVDSDDGYIGNAPVLVTSDGVSGHNKLKIYCDGDANTWSAVEIDNLGIVNDSDTYIRFYIYVYPAVDAEHNYSWAHIVEDSVDDFSAPGNGAMFSYFGIHRVDTTKWDPYFFFPDQATYNYWNTLEYLNVEEWYRVEMHIEWLNHQASGDIKFHIRIYDNADTLILDDDDFYAFYDPGLIHLDAYQVSNDIDAWTLTDSLKFGWNGPGNCEGAWNVLDYSCVKVANDDWIGPVIAHDNADLNQDSQVNIQDVQLCVNVILGTETVPAIVARADINNDNSVNVLDVQQIVNIILSS